MDGRLVEGYEGQTILEVCRDNGIEIPTLCYEPKLPGFGACRMCVVEVEGEEHPPISCSRTAEAGMKVQTQTDELRRLRKTNLELIFSDHNAYCLPPCQNKCPSHIDIPGFLQANAEANWRESVADLQAHDPVPQRPRPRLPRPVRGALPTRRGGRGHRDPRQPPIRRRPDPACADRRGRRAARPVREAGADRPPRGRDRLGAYRMASAYYLLLAGHDVTVLERDPAPGGMLRYGIPQYRLPKVEVLEAEYKSVEILGGKVVCNQELGKDFSLDDLQHQGYDAVVLAMGCYDTNKLGIPDEDADGVIDGLEYLRTATLGLPYPGHKGSRVVVVGGGFTAMDCVRTSVRQGAAEVTLVYRRDMKDMPASTEVHESIEEGVTAIFQAGPTRVLKGEDGKVEGIEFIRMKLGEPDASGRRRRSPHPAPSSRSPATACCSPSARVPS